MLYQHPGVYIEHVDSNSLAIEAASTSVTAFVSAVKRGGPTTAVAGVAVVTPVFISSVSQYAAMFGPVTGGPGGIFNNGNTADALGHAVNLYFANGGTKAYIVPVAKGDALGTPATKVLDFTADALNRKLTLTANSNGVWPNGLLVKLEPDALAGEFKLTIGTELIQTPPAANDAARKIDVTLETIGGLSLSANKSGFIEKRISELSTLVTAKLTNLNPAAAALPLLGLLAGGVDATAPVAADFSAAFDRMRDYRDMSIILLPGKTYVTGQTDATIYDSAITHAESMQNRLVVIDPDAATVLKDPVGVFNAKFPTSPYAVLYYPRVTVANPYYDPDTAAQLPKNFDLGPAPAAAGLWARIDGTRGVWKAPAGLEATVRGTLGPKILIGNDLQDNLNEWGVNCLRSIIGPTVIWGARTLATKSKPMYRYVSVRRTQSMIGESLYRALQAVVFEPNDYKLWGGLRASVNNFMDGLHRAGAFQGEKASDAYFVRCGLGATMTQGDIDAGIVRVVVGFAPLKPAEFVVVEIQQKVGQTN